MPHISSWARFCVVAILAVGFVSTLGTSGTALAARVRPSHRVHQIIYSIGPCHGTCPAYEVTLASDGGVTFVGNQFTSYLGRKLLRREHGLFARVVGQLAATQPVARRQTIAATNCSLYATDQQTVTITWQEGGRSDRILEFDLGCHDPQFGVTRRLISGARRLLPIDSLVGRRTEF